jgi:hypothetical protein
MKVYTYQLLHCMRAGDLQAAAEASQQQLREDWNRQRKALQAIVHG